MSLVAFSALCLTLLTCAAASAVLHKSNAIKFGPAAGTASPDVLPVDDGEQNLAIDTAQVSRITTSCLFFTRFPCTISLCDVYVFVLMFTFPPCVAARVHG